MPRWLFSSAERPRRETERRVAHERGQASLLLVGMLAALLGAR